MPTELLRSIPTGGPDSLTPNRDVQTVPTQRQRASTQPSINSDQQSSCFWSLWLRHRVTVKLICLRQFNGVVEEAEDACSVVLEKAHLSLPGKLSQIRNLDAWIYRMTINVCIDIKRGKMRRLRLTASGAAAANPQGWRPAVCSALDPESQLLGKELRNLIMKTIDRLPSRLVSAARLYFVEELTYDDLSEKLSITNANARKRVQEARKYLKISLAKHRLGARHGQE